jgi:hypothetical protein
MRLTILLFFTLILGGCFYPSTFFTPKAPTELDHTQRESVYIARQGLSIVVYSYANSDSLSIYLHGQRQQTPVYIDASDIKVERTDIKKIYIPMKHKYYKDMSGKYKGVDSGDIRYSVLVAEFDPEAGQGKSFTLWLPFAKHGVDKVIFDKVTKIRPLTIN